MMVLALACLPAKADPQSYQNISVTNLLTLTNSTAITGLSNVFNIPQNSQLAFIPSVTCNGTNNAATLTLGYNFQAGDGVWTTTYPYTNVITVTAGATVVPLFIANWTNFTGLAKGRLDYVGLSAGATNVVLNSVTIGQKSIQPY
jgi:hypothetical protein